jgi:type VI secretion system protein ImpH
LAWKKHRFPENYSPGARDRLSRYLLSLSGLGTPGLGERIGLPEESLAFYSGFLSMQAPSAIAIGAAAEYLSGTAVAVDQFIEKAIPLSPEDQTQLGSENAALGVDTVCGSYVWDCQSKFRLNLGPMKYAEFIRFLPSGDMLGPIFSLVKYMVGIEYEFEACIYLKREDVPPCVLGGRGTAARLGWTTWIETRDFVHEMDPFITFQESDLMSPLSVHQKPAKPARKEKEGSDGGN